MSEFCSRCVELSTQIELLKQQRYKEMQCMKEKLSAAQQSYKRVHDENERLNLDLAFYDKKVISHDKPE